MACISRFLINSLLREGQKAIEVLHIK